MFCVIQKWSRRVATMLPWLVIPLIGLWALSQLLPPAFRFEITSPRLACVFVLLVTLFWYEVLMPQLSAWRVRRNARLRERKRNEALELQKLKKTATRKCRNCLTPYRDQNPGGGKFMCSYCGHISKRPVLDLPVSPGISNSGIIKELFGKGGKILNGKPWSDNVSLCSQEWLENGNWVVNGSFPVKSSFPPRRNGVGVFGRSESCLAEKSYSGVYLFTVKLLTSFFLSIRWLCRKLFRISSSEESSSDADHRGMMSKKGENGSTGHESRGEKARRKAEEKRQARLEKELLEEEERKQREEVARLVEERRRLRDEKIEAENRAKGTSSLREKDSKKEAERRRQERRKEKDKGSSKSNSDVDELEKKLGKENDRKRDTERKNETDRRESPKSVVESVKGQNNESGYGAKGNVTNNFSRGNVGVRYFDRMRGTILSSSKAFTGSGFFGKAAASPVPASKEIKPNGSVDNSVSNSKIDILPPERLPGRSIMHADDKSNTRPVSSDMQRKTQPKSWQQLFTQIPPSHPNVISRPSAQLPCSVSKCSKSQSEVQSSQLPCSVSSTPLYDNPINLPSPFMLPSFSSGPLTNSSSLPVAKDPFFPNVSDMPLDFFPEEPELFEDPCYEPDPVSLLGPVSESLDNFQLDRGNSFVKDGIGKSCSMINVSTPLDVTRPSPIESPLSRMRVADEKPNNHGHFSSSPRAPDMNFFPAADLNDVNNKGTWHMWNSSPLGPDGLSLVGGSSSWITPVERIRLNNEDMMHQSPQKTMASLFTNEGHVASGTYSPQNVLTGNAQNFSAFGVSVPSSDDQDQRMQKFFPTLFSSESNLPISPTKEASEEKILFGSPSMAAANALDPSVASWSKNEWSVQGASEGVTNPSVVRSPFGGLYSPPDVQSLWSFE